MKRHFPSLMNGLRIAVFAYGVTLSLIGAATLMFGGLGHWTALIPSLLGLMVLLAGYGAHRRECSDGVAMAIAGGLAMLALSGTMTALPALPGVIADPESSGNPAATLSRAATAIASVAFAAAGVGLALSRILQRSR
jgi:hypothetical protein